MRRYGAARVHLADMKQVCRAFDVTLNDVALAAITNSYRTILLDRGKGKRGVGKTVPFAFSAWTIRLMTRLPQKSVTAGATYVSGPRRRQRVMGRQVLEVLPIPPIALHLRTGITMVSYATVSLFGVTADYDTAPDVDELANGIEDAVKRLAVVSRARRRTRGRPIPAASAS